MRYLSKVFVLTFLICLIISGKSLSNQMYQFSNLQNQLQILEENEEGLTLQLQIGDIRFAEVSTQQGNFNLIAIEGFARSQKISEPSLPVLNKMIAVPIDASVNYQIIASSYAEIDMESLGIRQLVMPTQVSVSKSDDPFSIPFEMNQSIYEQSSYYSLPLVETNDLGIMRGVRLGMISVSPVEYNPATNKIRVYNDITVKVTFENANYSKTYDNYDNHYSPFFEPIYDKLINAESMYGVNKSDLVTYPIKYLVIADRMFEAQLQPFLEWKTKKGYTVVAAYTDEIGTTTTSIKSYIQSLYNAGTPSDPAPSFVLFVGDAQQVPSWSGSAGSHITDLRYCEFTGDDFPEIYYGRFSAQNTAQLQPQIDKTLEYEQYQMPDPSYLERVTLVSGVDGTYAPTHGNGQINYGTDLYFNAAHGIASNVWLYPASDQSGAAGDIIESVSDGVGLYNYTAHCSHTGHADPSFTTSDVPGLTNFHQYLLGIGNCCLSNTFGTDYSTPCFGEAFLQLADAGGIGYIGGTNSTYWDEDYWWGVGYGPVVGSGPTYEETSIGVYDGLFHEHGEPVSEHYITNSAIMFAGNMAVTESGSSLTQYYWEIYHLMGDPSVMTYIGIPSVNTVSHDAVALITTTSFTVNAEPGSYVGISFNGVLQGAA
ncbi:MAG: gingipain R, partial [Calditrichaeota bacterium]